MSEQFQIGGKTQTENLTILGVAYDVIIGEFLF